mgnify:CR=1 FL=1
MTDSILTPEQLAAFRSFLATLDGLQVSALMDTLGSRVEGDREAAEIVGEDITDETMFIDSIYTATVDAIASVGEG